MAANRQALLEPHPEDAGADDRPLIEPNPDGILVGRRKERSLHGHSLYALKLGLRRSVARGDVAEAGRIGWELTTFRDAPIPVEEDAEGEGAEDEALAPAEDALAPAEDALGGVHPGFERVRQHAHTLLMEVFIEDVGDMGMAVEFIDAWSSLDPAEETYPAAVSRMAMALAAHPKSQSCHVASIRLDSFTSDVVVPFYPALFPVFDLLEEKYPGIWNRGDEEAWRGRLRAAILSEDPLERILSFPIADMITVYGKQRRIGRRSKSVYQVFQVLEETLPPRLAEAAADIRSVIHRAPSTRDYGGRLQRFWRPLLAAFLLDHAAYDGEMAGPREAMRRLLEADPEGLPDGRPGANRPLRRYRGTREFPEVRAEYLNPIRVVNLAPYVDVVARRLAHDIRRRYRLYPPLGQGGEEHPADPDVAEEVSRIISAVRPRVLHHGWGDPQVRAACTQARVIGAAAVAAAAEAAAAEPVEEEEPAAADAN